MVTIKLCVSAIMVLLFKPSYAQEQKVEQVIVKAVTGKATDSTSVDRKIYSQSQLKEIGIRILSTQALVNLPGITLKGDQIYLLGASQSNPVQIAIYDFNGTKTELNINDINIDQIDRMEILFNGSVEFGGGGGVVKIVLKPISKKDVVEYRSELSNGSIFSFENGIKYLYTTENVTTNLDFGGSKELSTGKRVVSDSKTFFYDDRGVKITQSSSSLHRKSTNYVSSYFRPEFIFRLTKKEKITFGTNFNQSKGDKDTLVKYYNNLFEYYQFDKNNGSDEVQTRRFSVFAKYQSSFMDEGTLLFNVFRSKNDISFNRIRSFDYLRGNSVSESTYQENQFWGSGLAASIIIPFGSHEANIGLQYEKNISEIYQSLIVSPIAASELPQTGYFSENMKSSSKVFYVQDRWSINESNSAYWGLRYESLGLSNIQNGNVSYFEMPSPILQLTHQFDEKQSLSVTFSKKYSTPIASVYVRTIGKTIDNSIVNSFVQKNTMYPELAKSIGVNYSLKLSEEANLDFSWVHKNIANLPIYQLDFKDGLWASNIIGTTRAVRNLLTSQFQFNVGSEDSEYSKAQVNLAYIASPSKVYGLKHRFGQYSPTKYEVKLAINYTAKTMPLSVGFNLGYQAYEWNSRSNSEYKKDMNKVLGGISFDYKFDQFTSLSGVLSNLFQKQDQTTKYAFQGSSYYLNEDRLRMFKTITIALNHKLH